MDLDVYYLFSQPGIRYLQTETLLPSFLLDLGENEKSFIRETINQQMMADIALFETMKSSDEKFRVFRLFVGEDEHFMVVSKKEEACCDIYSVRHNAKTDREQYRFLLDDDITNTIKISYGKIVGKHVLYLGASHVNEDGIDFVNIEEYLTERIYGNNHHAMKS
jgi:hypothetical protein